jgi:hypothetical protein
MKEGVPSRPTFPKNFFALSAMDVMMFPSLIGKKAVLPDETLVIIRKIAGCGFSKDPAGRRLL